ncbi:MAG: hypothetical protein R3240_02600, partial [Gammaproteobacteria bacterium]|nr:hypothetical protein [Gammaproteobacteria bacterium]
MKTLVILLVSLFSAACVSVPDVYIIDRHTVMEADAAGEWPELEKRFLDKSLSKGPEDLRVDPNQNRK